MSDHPFLDDLDNASIFWGTLFELAAIVVGAYCGLLFLLFLFDRALKLLAHACELVGKAFSPK